MVGKMKLSLVPYTEVFSNSMGFFLDKIGYFLLSKYC